LAFDYDLFTIGGGSGGVRASRVSASYGAKVAIAEDGRFGGTCVNVGCIPKKLFSYAAHFREDFEIARGYGWAVGETSFDWPTLLQNKDREIARLNGIYERLLANAGVTIHRARAHVADPHTVEVGGKRVTAKHILVATGSWPVLPPIPGIEHAITSNEAFALERLPERAIVVGAGYIALEFASIFHGLGVQDHPHLSRQAPAARLRRRARHAHRGRDERQGHGHLPRLRAGCDPEKTMH
jgi:glutathione reductase (NADPH)